MRYAPLLLLAACAGSRVPAPALAGRDWTLVALGDEADPRGADGRPLTLRLEQADHRAGGFAGCNRFGGSYRLVEDSLSFGPLAATRMACPAGMDLEQRFLAMLGEVRRYQATDSTLSLLSPAGITARFEARPAGE